MAIHSIILILLAASAVASAQQCGVTFIAPNITRTRVVGGTEARANSYPWMVSLQGPLGPGGKLDHFCGGTLIRASDTKEESDIILTAAHCVEDFFTGNLQILIGGHNLFKPSPGQELIRGVKIKRHESWDSEMTGMPNDIALVKLEKPIKFSNTIQPACLPQQGEQLAEGSRTIVTGWGLLEYGGKEPDTLQQAIVPVYKAADCMKETGLPHVNTQMCAGYQQGKIDSCSQDSGGPLVLKNANNRYVVHGVVSWGEKCALANNPGVYTRVSAFVNWIKQYTKELTLVK